MTEDAPLRRRRPEERDRSAPWIAVIAVALALGVVLFLVLNGRDDDTDTARTTTPATTTETVTETVSEEPTETPSEAETATEEPTTPQTEGAVDQPTTPVPAGEQTGEQTGEPTTPAPTFEPVDPADYHDAGLGAYFFTASEERLRCGLFTEGDTKLSGCQATAVVPSLPECDNPDSNAPIVTLGETGPAFPECTTQGIFVVDDARELPVDRSITVDRITCSRDTAGISCHNEETGYGFRASLDEFTAVP